MADFRELKLDETLALLRALANERTRAYEKAVEYHDASSELEISGQSGYGALDNEADRYEELSSTVDDLMELVAEGRVVILKKGV